MTSNENDRRPTLANAAKTVYERLSTEDRLPITGFMDSLDRNITLKRLEQRRLAVKNGQQSRLGPGLGEKGYLELIAALGIKLNENIGNK